MMSGAVTPLQDGAGVSTLWSAWAVIALWFLLMFGRQVPPPNELPPTLAPMLPPPSAFAATLTPSVSRSPFTTV